MKNPRASIAPACRRNLLALARSYAAVEGISEVAALRRAYGDGHLLGRLKGGGSVTIETYDDLVDWFHDNWPSGRGGKMPRLERLDRKRTGRVAPAGGRAAATTPAGEARDG